MKATHLNISLILLLIFIGTSCNLEEYDAPDVPNEDISITEHLQGALIQTTFNQVAITERTTNVLMQYLDEYDFSVNQLTGYNIGSSYFNEHWSSGLYNGSLKSANELLKISQDQGLTNAEAIAKIILALEYGNTTLFFGDIPFSEALLAEEGILDPKFDSQEAVYNAAINLLEEAITVIPDATDLSLQQVDLFANGDMSRWKQLAYGLLARYTIQRSKKDPTSYEKALMYLSNSYPFLNEEVTFTYGGNLDLQHPLYRFSVERPSTYKGGEKVIARMTTEADPRLQQYYNDEGGYENGFWSRRNSFVPIVSYVELQFVKAESQLMTGLSDTEVSATLASAIKASMNQNLVEGEQYIIDHSDLSIYSTTEQKLEHIIGEAYYSYYGYASKQSWNNYRRTGYPTLTLTGFPSETNPTGVIPKRFPYPLFPFNAVNFQRAKNNQGGAELDDALWIYE